MLLILRWYPSGRLAGLVAAAAFVCAPCARAQQVAAATPKGDESRATPALARTGLWFAGAGGGALLAGVVTGFVAKEREHDAWAACRHGSGGRPECPESTRADFDAANTFATATNVLLIGGGLLSVVGIGLVIVAAKSEVPQARAAVELTPALGLDGPGMAVSGAF